ncbi:hypothetical protein [Lentibacillus cibarius]|nr:hypothetical protein [Lentibacillus cibarius]
MQKTRRNTMLKAFGLSLIITLIAFFVVDNQKPNTTIYLLVVGIASFVSLNVIYLITSRAYEKFLKEN